MSKVKSDAKEIIKKSLETLEMAKFGMTHVRSSDPKQRMFGLRNVVVFGRAVTNVIQNLRSAVDNFDEWYGLGLAV
jgi:hypothetical protein